MESIMKVMFFVTAALATLSGWLMAMMTLLSAALHVTAL